MVDDDSVDSSLPQLSLYVFSYSRAFLSDCPMQRAVILSRLAEVIPRRRGQSLARNREKLPADEEKTFFQYRGLGESADVSFLTTK